MKKILLGTTALIGAAGLFASGALAGDGLQVKVGGFANWQIGIMSDDLDGAQHAQGFRNDTEVKFSVDGVADNGLQYGANIDLEADVTGDADGEGFNASRTYLHLGGNWGRLEMGSNTGAAQALKVDASNIARATGGIDGDYRYFANSNGAPFITSPSLIAGHGITTVIGGSETVDNNNKLTYYSPRFSGFQVGVSYAPDLTDSGQTVARADSVLGHATDVFDVALNYQGQFSQVGVAAALTGQWGDSDVAALEDIRAWNLGASLSYMGFSVAASYGDWSDSLNVSAGDDSDYWTLGAAYATGPFGISITYLTSNFDTGAGDNDFDAWSVGADYQLAPGLTPYAEVTWYDQDPAAVVPADNDGTVFIVGAELAF